MKRLSSLFVTWILLISCQLASALDQTLTGFFYPTGKSQLQILGHGWFGARDIDGYRPMGVWHCGSDLGGKLDNSIYAIADGKIVKVSQGGWSDSDQDPENFAYLILHTLANGDRFIAVYGHLHRPATLAVDMQVSAGQKLGQLGPWAYGAHIHFGIYQNKDNPTDENIPSSGYGRQPNPRPDVEVIDNINIYNNWFDPIKFIETKNPYLAPSQAIESSISYEDYAPRAIYGNDALSDFFKGPGRRLAFLSNRSGSQALYYADIDTDHGYKITNVTKIYDAPQFISQFSVSQGNRHILFLDKTNNLYCLILDHRTLQFKRFANLKIKVKTSFFPSWLSDNEFIFADNNGYLKKGTIKEKTVRAQDKIPRNIGL